ncbi:MAG TPA: sulfite oxidase-like oxidoreductase [Candidatus Saccharimonadales bacterium]|nr:sulfite oxidase-like oxidoreductase [Candidatus Saccharimonadales bacterium]
MSVINSGFFGKGQSDKRLPPGQSEVKGWPVLTYGATPHIDTATWSLTVDGEVHKPITLTWHDFNQLQKTVMQADIHCVTRWSKLGMEWQGVSIDDLIKLAGGLTNDAHHLIATCDGDYTTNVPVADVQNGQALIAVAAGGQPLTDEHGGPARLFVPHLYFWKSAKWVQRLTFTSADKPGFWEVNGYHNYGDPWREQRYDTD